MPGDLLRAPILKIERAKQHIDELNREILRFAERKPYRVVLEADAQPGLTAFITRVREEAPPQLASIIGDAVHNLRSTFDHIAACIVPGGTTDRSVQFPFCHDANALEDTIKRRHIDRARPDAVDVIRDLKPYAGGNDVLYTLSELDNADKHRLLIPVLQHLGINMQTVRPDGMIAFDFQGLKIGPVRDGMHIMTMPKPGNMELGDEFKPAFSVVFGPEPPFFARRDVLETLVDLASYVGEIVERFRPFV